MPDLRPPLQLEEARKVADWRDGYQRFGSWQHFGWSGKPVWALNFALEIGSANESLVPRRTEWWAVVDEAYPFGFLAVFPSKVNGLDKVFQHQMYGVTSPEHPWLNNHLCLGTPGDMAGMPGGRDEPHSSRERLDWNIERTQEWLLRASNGTLAQDEDHFELPDFGRLASAPFLVFREDESSFATWQDSQANSGTWTGRLVEFNPSTKVYFVERWLHSSAVLGQYEYQLAFPSNPCSGIWVRLPTIPVLPVWNPPRTWGELRDCCKQMNMNLLELLHTYLRHFRGKKKRSNVIILVGFPVRELIGSPDSRMHWQPITVSISGGDALPRRGSFRRGNEGGYFLRDQEVTFKRDRPLTWQWAENWTNADLRARGSLDTAVLGLDSLLLGAGAIGSAVAEMMVRGGLKRLSIVDGDYVKSGNLVRHTLGLESLGQPKAAALARRLQTLSPDLVVSSHDTDLQTISDQIPSTISASLVLDCTANFDVPALLAARDWSKEMWFVSASIGYQARRIYIFTAKLSTYPVSEYYAAMKEWMLVEQGETSKEPQRRDGVACWNQVFPATSADIWLASTVIVKHLTRMLVKNATLPQLAVFEAGQDEADNLSVKRIQ